MKRTKVVIVIPTYNEKENIGKLIDEIMKSKKRIFSEVRLKVLVVDDLSPDGTVEVVKFYQKKYCNVHYITGKKRGLGSAYVRGFKYALNNLSADVVVQMDADFSHSPADIPRFLNIMARSKYNLVIGSRYTKGGTIPLDWPVLRVWNSKIGNWVARNVAGLEKIEDCTGGLRAIEASILRKIDLDRIGATGYSFQMNLLHALLKRKARAVEVPINFVNRKIGKTKMRFFDKAEFVVNAFKLRYRSEFPTKKHFFNFLRPFLFKFLAVGAEIALIGSLVLGLISLKEAAFGFFAVLSILIASQSIFTLWTMIYAWEQPERIESNKSPKNFLPPHYSFTALLPALHEERVIGETIRSVAEINYPDHLKEVLIICRYDDLETVQAARQAISELGVDYVKLIIPDFLPKNKPDKLNYAVKFATKNVICVFDAEDNPHKEIFNVVNTTMRRDHSDVIQSGVQLTNFRSNWFSTLNVLEYYFWFKSVLHLFSSKCVIPLGGNTVFFKKKWLLKIKGWDANCLTEDADIGIRLSIAGAKIRIIYDEEHATQEETPTDIGSFIKQRTRWNQGFVQIFKKSLWKKLPTFSQRFLTAYILIWPEVQASMFIYIALSVVMIFTVKVPILLALVSVLPLYVLFMHFVVLNIGLYEFTRSYGLKYPFWMPLKVFVTFIPFQLTLGFSALRSVYREMRKENSWEKTRHVNAHRLIRPAEQRNFEF